MTRICNQMFWTALLATAIGFASPAMAQHSPPPDSTLIKEFSADTIGKAFVAMEIEYKVMEDGKGPSYLTFTYDGLKMSIYPTACEKDTNKKCLGAFLTASWDPYEGVSRGEMLERINAFDSKYDFADAALYADNSPFLSRYWIGDYGMNYGNLRVEMQAFAGMSHKFSDEIDKPYVPAEPAMLPIEKK